MEYQRRDGGCRTHYVATTTCPDCGATNAVEVNDQQRPPKVMRARVHCACGRCSAVELERRAGVRKHVTLHGHCRRRGDSDVQAMTIRNLSRSGLLFEPGGDRPLQMGEQVEVSFSFGHHGTTFIHRTVRVMRREAAGVGAEFSLGSRRAPLSPAEDLALAQFTPDIRSR